MFIFWNDAYGLGAYDETYAFPNHEYEPFLWKGNLLWLETFRARYETELARDRKDRIAAIEKFISENLM